jgi:hypothetical protein
MDARMSRQAGWGAVAALAVLVAACNGNGNVNVVEPVITATPAVATPTHLPAATATNVPPPSATPTATLPPNAGVAGLVVLRSDVVPGAPEAQSAPPSDWASPADAAAFDRAMGNADWTVEGPATRRGVTSVDGRFTISDLPPGQYTLQVAKTLKGNLVPVTVPFTVGDDGRATIVAEVGMGLVRTLVTYTQAGVQVREARGPYGNVLVTRDGRISQLGDGSRTLVDADGDGSFDVGPCTVGALQTCGSNGQCPERLACQCLPSCPACDDCGPGICTSADLPRPFPGLYRCGADDTCVNPGDACTCVPSCPDCKDCALRVCVPGCKPLDITGVLVTAPAQVVVGRQAQATASAALSDGSTIDVTYLASWQSSNAAVATVDSWGTISTVAVGDTTLTATVGAVRSAPQPLAVVERPTLQRITVQNQSCYCGPIFAAAPATGVAPRPCMLEDAPASTDILPIPSCGQVLLVGATLQFSAIGQFADGSYEDITAQVTWEVTPAAVGTLQDGLFTAAAPGTAQITAALDAVVSDPTDMRVVDHPTLDSLSIYAANVGYGVVDARPAASASPCFDCGIGVTVLRGDQLAFQATAHYDTGDWRDVTASVSWKSSAPATATIDAGGAMSAVQGGDAVIDARLESLTSNPVNVHVVNQATLQSIFIYQEGTDRVVSKGDQRFFHATGYYDIGISRDVTASGAWHSSDDSVGGFDSPGVFTGHTAGTVQVWVELDGQVSPPLLLEVFEVTELAYCDAAAINRAVWSDNFNRVTLESDCAAYTEPGLVTLRYTVTETQPHGGIFDPCLDLYVYQGDQLVRTIREEGCGEPFLAGAAPGSEDAVLKYQLRAFWDLRDQRGAAVPSGDYVIYGRFYLYYDPVVKLPITVYSGNEPVPTRTPTPVAATPVVAGHCVQAATPRDCGDATASDSQFKCCERARLSQSPVPFWWCPAAADGSASCEGCSDPCAGVPAPVLTPTPTPASSSGGEGACYIGSSTCTGSYFATAQTKCCDLFRFGAMPLATSWCPSAQLDATTGQCTVCPATPCDGVAPS